MLDVLCVHLVFPLMGHDTIWLVNRPFLSARYVSHKGANPDEGEDSGTVRSVIMGDSRFPDGLFSP
jgi:hypothetical protein